MTCSEDGQSYGACLGEVLPTAEKCVTSNAADEDCNGEVNDHCGLWSEKFGTLSDQLATSLALDSSGNIFLAGHFVNTIDMGGGLFASAGGNDIILAKLDPSGKHIWSKRFGDIAEQQCFGLAVDASGNVIITGSFQGSIVFGGSGAPTHTDQGAGNIFVAKFSPDGTYQWSRAYGDATAQVGRAIAVDSAGRILLTGQMAGTINPAPASSLTASSGKDGFLLQLSAIGNPIWSRVFGGMGDDSGQSVAVAAADDVLVTGYFQQSMNLGGPLLTSGGGFDVFVARLNASGGHVWSKAFSASQNQKGLAVATDASGSALVLGELAGTLNLGGNDLVSAGPDDIFALKLSSAGDHVWSTSFGDAGDQEPTAIAVDPKGDVIFTGGLEGTVNFGDHPLSSSGLDDVFLVKLSGVSGAHVWSRSFGNSGDQDGRALTTDPMGNIYITGNFTGTIDFGSGEMASAGNQDIFIAKLVP